MSPRSLPASSCWMFERRTSSQKPNRLPTRSLSSCCPMRDRCQLFVPRLSLPLVLQGSSGPVDAGIVLLLACSGVLLVARFLAPVLFWWLPSASAAEGEGARSPVVGVEMPSISCRPRLLVGLRFCM